MITCIYTFNDQFNINSTREVPLKSTSPGVPNL